MRRQGKTCVSLSLLIYTLDVYFLFMKSGDIIAALKNDGWYEVATKGSHVQFKHPTKPGRVTVPHPERDIPVGTLKSIERQPRSETEIGSMMRNYIGLIHKDADSDFGVSFPDFPGVVTAGTDLDDARRLAEEALAFHVEGLVEDGEAVPEPSSLDAVMADPDNRNGVAILVSLKGESRKSVRTNVTLSEDVLNAIDAYAESQGLTRSGFLARAARREMANSQDAKEYALSA